MKTEEISTLLYQIYEELCESNHHLGEIVDLLSGEEEDDEPGEPESAPEPKSDPELENVRKMA